MTKQVRDWQFDTKLCSKVKEDGHTEVTADIVTDIATHWLKQYAHEANQVCYWKGEAAAEKERANELIKKLGTLMISYPPFAREELKSAIYSLYPEEGEAKKYTFKAILHIYNGIRTMVSKEQRVIEAESAEEAEKLLREKIECQYKILSHLSLSGIQLELVEEGETK